MLKHPVAAIETIDAASDGDEPFNNGSVARCDRVVTNINDQDRRECRDAQASSGTRAACFF
jgi:hypothetical protein